jgi:hydrogenase/urease accessory protein HupE
MKQAAREPSGRGTANRAPAVAMKSTCLLIIFLVCLAARVHAHDPGLSGVEIRVESGQLSAHLMLTKEDTHRMTLAGDAPSFEALLPGALEISVDDKVVIPTSQKIETDDRDFVHISQSFGTVTGHRLRVRSALFPHLPRSHRQYLAVLQDGQKIGEQMLDAEQSALAVTLSGIATPPAKPPTFGEFLKLGLEHIFTGYDHLVFLFGLLIVGGSLRAAVKIITSFTVAHSITLALATLGLVSLSGKIVEPLIAASIMYVGIENLFRRDLNRRWMLTFGFGLAHGLGFAAALRDLGVGANGTGVAVPLLSFNLGVELGQLYIAGFGLPIIWKLTQLPRFERLYAPACSVMVLVAGGRWLLERTLLQ